MFTTDALPSGYSPAQKARLWADNMNAEGGFDVYCPRPDGFRARIEVLSLGAIEVHHAYASSMNTSRTKQHIDSDSNDAITILVSEMDRPMTVRGGGTEATIRRGDAIVLDQCVPNSTNLPLGGQVLGLTLPRAMLRERKAELGNGGIRHVLAGSGPLSLFAAYTRQMLVSGAELSEAELAVAAAHLGDLASLLLSRPGDQRGEITRIADSSGRVRLICSAIQQNAHEIDLDAADIGRLFHLSGRSVQHILRSAQTTFTEELRKARVVLAVDMLQRKENRHRSVADIAFLSGFSDVSTFYRAMRLSGHPHPSEFRGKR